MTVSTLIGIFEERAVGERLEDSGVEAATTSCTIDRIAVIANEQRSIERPQSRWSTATSVKVRRTQESRV